MPRQPASHPATRPATPTPGAHAVGAGPGADGLARPAVSAGSPPARGSEGNAATSVKILTFNLLSGGIGRSRAERRFEGLLQVIQESGAHAACLQECLYWDENDARLLHLAERVLGMRAVLGLSPRTRMHTAILVRPPLWIAETRVLADGIWHHSAVRAVVGWDGGGDQRMLLVSAHFAARRRQRRLLEAEDLCGHFEPEAERGQMVVVGIDTNTPDEQLPAEPLNTGQASRFLHEGGPDTRPVEVLAAAGLTDAAPVGPAGAERTTGHWPGHFPDRPDRLLVSRAAAAALRAPARVLETADEISDHRPLLAELALPEGAPQ